MKRYDLRWFIGVLLVAIPMSALAGSIVFDPQNYLKNLISAENSIRQVQNQVAMYQNQLQGVMYQAQNLRSLGHFNSLYGIQNELQNVVNLQNGLGSLHNDLNTTDSGVAQQYQAYVNSDLTPNQYFQAQEQAGQTQTGLDATSYQAAKYEMQTQLPQDWNRVQTMAAKVPQVKGMQANMNLLNEQMSELLRQNNELLTMTASAQEGKSTQSAQRTRDEEKAIQDENTHEAVMQNNKKATDAWFQKWDTYYQTHTQ